MIVLIAVWPVEGCLWLTHVALCLCSTGTGGCSSRLSSEGDAALGTSGMSKPAELRHPAQGHQAVGRTSSARKQVSDPCTNPCKRGFGPGVSGCCC